MLSYLEVANGFINISQDSNAPTSQNWTKLPNGVQLRMPDIGVLEVRPTKNSEQDLVLSCGIHGNETAPIEIISKLISQIVTGNIEPKVNLLFILGNPESMKIADRFVSINMNRLFAGAFKNYPVNDDNRYELERAERLEALVTEFYANEQSKKIHLDLHTAIKPSYHKTFAIRPFNPTSIDDKSKKLLSSLGIEAVLQHNKVSTTFSYFSVANFKAEAYTLELGKVKPFGENIAGDFAKASDCLIALIKDEEPGNASAQPLIEYKVVAEIMRNSEEFKFYVDNNVDNFTPFPQGYLIAEDVDYSYRVAFERESVVFPNTNVPVGQRVALMVTRKEG